MFPMLIGLVIGILVGLAIGPLLRSWLAWREYAGANREARLHEQMLERMAPDRPPVTRKSSVAKVG
jgi:hypothetical protein